MNKKTHFGYKEVDVEAKAQHVGGVFSSVADSYDLMNDAMSIGLHRLWKRILVEIAGIKDKDVTSLNKICNQSYKDLDNKIIENFISNLKSLDV